MPFPLIPFIVISVVSLLGISVIGGFGLAFGVFKGLTTIPPIAYIVVGVFIVLFLFRGLRR